MCRLNVIGHLPQVSSHSRNMSSPLPKGTAHSTRVTIHSPEMIGHLARVRFHSAQVCFPLSHCPAHLSRVRIHSREVCSPAPLTQAAIHIHDVTMNSYNWSSQLLQIRGHSHDVCSALRWSARHSSARVNPGRPASPALPFVSSSGLCQLKRPLSAQARHCRSPPIDGPLLLPHPWLSPLFAGKRLRQDEPRYCYSYSCYLPLHHYLSVSPITIKDRPDAA